MSEGAVVLENSSPSVTEMRTRALESINSILSGSEPDKILEISPGRSYDYVSRHAVSTIEDLNLKAEVARIWIGEMVDEGNYAQAVDALLYDGVPETNIPEMQNADFVGNLLQRAQESGNTFQAHRIAATVLRLEKMGEREKLFKTYVEGSKFNEGWTTRERLLYEKGVREALTRATQTEGFDWDVLGDVELEFQGWFLREDGYYSDHPHPLATDTARVYCQMLAESGLRELAYQFAVEAKLPYADLTTFEAALTNSQKVKANLRRHFRSLLERTH